MKPFAHMLYLSACIILLGCSTGDYLKPIAPYGQYSTENPACPGAEEVIELLPTDRDWIFFRAAAKLPNKFDPEGTKLIVYFRFVYYHLGPEVSAWSSLFPSAEVQEKRNKLFEARANEDIIISAASPIATIVLPDGNTTTVSLPFFEKPFNHKEVEYPNTVRGPEVLISPDRLENFKVIFPDIFFNEIKLDIPPVEFRRSRGTYAPVLNC